MPEDVTVELGVELLAEAGSDEIELADALDRIETVTTNPATTRTILDTAVMRGVIERENGVVRATTGSSISFGRDVVSREGEFECRRCGSSLDRGYFLKLESGEHGPFGPTCVKHLLND